MTAVISKPGSPPDEPDGTHDIVQRLLADHGGIAETADRLSAFVRQTAPPPIDAIATLRWRLVRQILTHLPIEDCYVYRPLEANTRPAVAHLAGAFRRDLNSLYAAFQAHVRHWTGDAVVRDWAGYQQAFPPLRDRLVVRMQREETELFPLLDPQALRAIRPRRDWTRDVHLLKTAIVDPAAGDPPR